MHSANRRRPAPRTGALLVGLAGLVAVVVGTFLPWVTSGEVDRNLYTIAGVVDHIGVLGPGRSVSGWVALIGPLCVIPVLLAVLRLSRWAAATGLVIAVACGGFAGTALALAAGRSAAGISLALQGPVTVLVGGVLLVAGALGILVVRTPANSRAVGGDHLPQSPARDAPDRSHW